MWSPGGYEVISGLKRLYVLTHEGDKRGMFIDAHTDIGISDAELHAFAVGEAMKEFICTSAPDIIDKIKRDKEEREAKTRDAIQQQRIRKGEERKRIQDLGFAGRKDELRLFKKAKLEEIARPLNVSTNCRKDWIIDRILCEEFPSMEEFP